MFATIKAKLITTFATLALVTICLGVLGVMKMSTINDQSTEMSVNWMPSIDSVHQLNTATSDLRVLQYVHIASTDDVSMRNVDLKIAKIVLTIRSIRARYEKLISSDRERSIYNQFSGKYERYLEITNQILALSRQNKNAEAVKMMEGTLPLYDDLSDDLLKLVKLNVDGGNAASAAGDEIYATSRLVFALLTVLGVIVGVGAAAWMTRNVSGGLTTMGAAMAALVSGKTGVEIAGTERQDEVGAIARTVLRFRDGLEASTAEKERISANQAVVVTELTRNLHKLAKGDLTARIDADVAPEYAGLKANFNDALNTLGGTIGAVSTGADAIRTGSMEIAQASEDLARRTEGNAASLEETSAALVQIDTRLKTTALSSSQTVTRADQAIATVEGGRATADEAVQAMGRVSESAKGIDSVIEGLDKIAFQTRVLAMNAAVEAGRAGDAGRGFAVVADLVSALAMRAEEEAKRARDQLTLTQTDIVTAVQAVKKVDGALVNISGDVDEVHQLLGKMAEDTTVQSSAITQITAAISAMDQSTQQNAAMVEETSAAARNLTTEVTSLAAQAAMFKTGHGALQRDAAPVQVAPVAPTKAKGPASTPYRSPVNAPSAMAGAATGAEGWDAF